jgi:phage tail tape-measure protein
MPNVEFLFVLKDKLSSGLKGINKNVEQLDASIKGATVRLEHFKKQTENISKLGNKVKDVGKGLTLGVTLPIVAMGGAMVKASADIEAMQQQLSTMLGSAEAGGKMFKEIQTMASKTPFETKDLMQATNNMLTFGVAQKDIIPIMQMLGDISGGNAERFKTLSFNFAQLYAQAQPEVPPPIITTS